MKKYIVMVPVDKNSSHYKWIQDSEWRTIEEAQERARKLTDFEDPYTEPGGELHKMFFGSPNTKEGWDAKIDVIHENI